MRVISLISLLAAIVFFAAATLGFAANDPYIGYVYPAGGQQGTTFQVIVGGQRLGNSGNVYISGTGVSATVVRVVGAGGPLTKLQQDELRRRIDEIRTTRTGRQANGRAAQKANAAVAAVGAPVVLPDLPELRNLEQQTAAQLQRLVKNLINPQNRPKPPIAEQVTLQVTMDPNAAPGDRELRLRTTQGLSNPLVFQVGAIPEELGGGKDDDLTPPAPAQPPIVVNGQVMPGEVDHFPLTLKAGQKLVIAAQARKLIPYLADAVPGWFQAVVAIYDPSGKQVAYGNECGFSPDPAFIYQVPKDGQYTLEVRDAIYRGREDFVYRVDVADASMAKTLFPLGARGGVLIGASKLDPQLCLAMAQEHFGLIDNPIKIASEVEPNETGQTSMPVTMPRIISGTISKPGDKDVFRIQGHAGEQVVAEVYARRMGSALDPMLRLIDTKGKVVAWNDDCEDQCEGLFTHQADSYLIAKLPANGTYFVQLTDAQRHGGPEYAYFLRISHPQPDFELRITPSCLNIPSGRAITATVYAMRKDGWDGDIQLALQDAPAGFTLGGATIPKGRNQVRITVAAPRNSNQATILQIVGTTQVGGKGIIRPAVAAEDMMQAFAYRHLVPSQQLMAVVVPSYGVTPTLDLPAGGRLAIPAGGSAKLSVSVGPAFNTASASVELSDPPAGVTLANVSTSPGKFTLTFKADTKHIGYADNLIVEGFGETNAKRAGTAKAQKQRVSLGVLPAIPFEIVKQ